MRNLVLRGWNRFFVSLQKLAKAMLIPLMVMPFIILLNTLGEHISFFSTVGSYTTIYLPVIFAVGVAVGLSDDKNGYVAVGAVAFYVIGMNSLSALQSSIPLGTFQGVVAGICATAIYNRAKNVSMPVWFTFLSGYRFTLLLTIVASVFVNLLTWPLFEYFDILGIKVGEVVLSHRSLGAFVYGTGNRLLLPFGLHHLLNNFVFTQLGEFHGIRGELNRFLNGDTTAGYITGGMFPVAIFGLPAAALAMFLCTDKNKRKKVAAFSLTVAANSIITGITEPIEYMFIFASPFLYFLHMILTGISHFLMSYFDVRVVYSFASGLLDYTVASDLGENPRFIIYIGLMLFFVYFSVFYFSIKLLKVKIFYPFEAEVEKKDKLSAAKDADKKSRNYILAEKYIQAVGGADNISELFSCATRLRLSVRDMSLVDDEAILMRGALGVSKMGGNYLQIVIGIGVDAIFKEMNEIWLSEKGK
ncbi:PTS system N-acetylglucosamine-specific EIICB component [Clostridia bacterium]|nr:PTS system N-acetylglucosamine-specific EIICB component [Clostridia bacterium]